jgi:hypothetical protein
MTSLLGSAGGANADAERERQRAQEQEEDETPACPPGTTLEDAEAMADNGEECVMAPQVKHESYQVFKFVGSAEEEKHAVIRGDVDGCSLTCKGAVARMNVVCERWAHRKNDMQAHAACTHSVHTEVPHYCEVDKPTCSANPGHLGPKGHRTKVPGSQARPSTSLVFSLLTLSCVTQNSPKLCN